MVLFDLTFQICKKIDFNHIWRFLFYNIAEKTPENVMRFILLLFMLGMMTITKYDGL